MQSALRFTGILLLVALLVGCQTLTVRTDFDPSASFEQRQRWAWLEPPLIEGRDPFADNTLLRKRVRSAVEAALSARGYREVAEPEAADFLVTYSVILDERVRVDGGTAIGIGAYDRFGYGRVYSGPSVRNYQESTLIIDVLEPETRDLIWRGWAGGVLDTRDRERSRTRLQDGVRQILEEFPPESGPVG